MERQEILALLNAPTKQERLENLTYLLAYEKEKPEVKKQYANNHIHTFYSFSPYSPTAAVWFARREGLTTAGIMDHDSIAGADEFRKAGLLCSVGTTCGFECRVRVEDEWFAHRRINNPDQNGIAYLAFHSVPAAYFGRVHAIFKPLLEHRNRRNRLMTERINTLISDTGIRLDFDRDVLPLSKFSEGGSVTERHLLYALSLKIIEQEGAAEAAEFLASSLGLVLSPKQIGLLSDENNQYFTFDLLGILKSGLVEKFYVPATDECLTLEEAVTLGKEIDCIVCYAYLGDVAESPTGDKQAAKFEDDYLEELLGLLYEKGVRAVTYMPSRNTPEQLERLMALCMQYNILQISGEDINSPRQSFICKELATSRCAHLVDAAWDLVRREENCNKGM